DLRLLAVRQHGSHARAGVEARNAGAARAHALGQGALGTEFDLELARKILPLELLVLADIGADHLADLPGAEQLAEPEIVDARVVREGGDVAHAGFHQRVDERFGNAAKAKASRGNAHPVRCQAIKRRPGVVIYLLHSGSPSSKRADEVAAV